MKKFPKVIYVRWEANDYHDESYMIVDHPEPSGEDGDKVAIYKLDSVKTKRVVESLE